MISGIDLAKKDIFGARWVFNVDCFMGLNRINLAERGCFIIDGERSRYSITADASYGLSWQEPLLAAVPVGALAHHRRPFPSSLHWLSKCLRSSSTLALFGVT